LERISNVEMGEDPSAFRVVSDAIGYGKNTSISALSKIRRSIRQATARRSASTGPHGVVLLYHRVAEPDVDPWDLSVSPQNFSEQMEVLKSMGNCMTFTDFAESLSGATPAQRSIAVTFDDGYRDNLTAALPILESSGVPATVFVTSGMVGTERDFWWDALARVFLAKHPLPGVLSLQIAGVWHKWVALEEPADSGLLGRHWDRGFGSRSRKRAFYDIWSSLLAMPLNEIERVVEEVMKWAGLDRAGCPEDRPLDVDELKQLAASTLIEIGAHTVAHAPLTKVSPERCAQEIAPSQAALHDTLGREVTSFSFPFGMHNKSTMRSARDAGFDCSCTVVEDIVTPRTDPYRIPRIQVKNWPGDVFEAALRKYVGPN